MGFGFPSECTLTAIAGTVATPDDAENDTPGAVAGGVVWEASRAVGWRTG